MWWNEMCSWEVWVDIVSLFFVLCSLLAAPQGHFRWASQPYSYRTELMFATVGLASADVYYNNP